jgi:hypothetical protein
MNFADGDGDAANPARHFLRFYQLVRKPQEEIGKFVQSLENFREACRPITAIPGKEASRRMLDIP